jgi:hypothetical protein
MFAVDQFAKIEKKHKYLLYSFVISVLVFMFSFGVEEYRVYLALIVFAVTLLGAIISHYPNVSVSNIVTTLLLPGHLVAGALLSLIYFPNLGLPIKILLLVSFGLIFYIVSLANNVFLVVEERGEPIPLYRAAVTWSHILIVLVAIPYFAGIYKLPINAFYQNGLTSFFALLFSLYSMWFLKFDADVKRVGVEERLVLGLFVIFMVFIFGLMVSFFPAESFLRALFVASVLMSGLSYLQSHLKNSVTKKSVIESFIITAIFFILLIVFK